MSGWTNSLVMLVPAENIDSYNQMTLAMGYTAEEFAIPLSLDGTTVTHYGNHAWGRVDFINMLLDAAAGTLPEAAWEDFGLTSDDVVSLIGGMVISVEEPGDPETHLANVLEATGLSRIDPHPIGDSGGAIIVDPGGGKVIIGGGKIIADVAAVPISAVESDPENLQIVSGAIGVLRLSTDTDYSEKISEIVSIDPIKIDPIKIDPIKIDPSPVEVSL